MTVTDDNSKQLRIPGKPESVLVFLQVAARPEDALVLFMSEEGKQMQVTDSAGQPIYTVKGLLESYTDHGHECKRIAGYRAKQPDNTGCVEAYQIAWEWVSSHLRKSEEVGRG